MKYILPKLFTHYSRLLYVLLAAIFLVSGCRAEPLDPPAELLCATYCVGEPFAAFYDASGGAIVFGEPISGVMGLSSDEAIISQYFESMRLDYNRQTETISIPDLGRWAFEGLPEEEREAMDSTVHAVAPPFAEFYARYDGKKIFGQPLSPLMRDGALRAQYFENGRLEWQPGLSTASGLYSGSIGRAHFDQTAYSYDVIAQPLPNDQRLTRVNLSAVVAAPILYAGNAQTFYVAALSPAQIPADNLRIEIEIKHGGRSTVLKGTTDMNGRVEIELAPEAFELTPGERVQATVTAYNFAEEPLDQTTISFESWW